MSAVRALRAVPFAAIAIASFALGAAASAPVSRAQTVDGVPPISAVAPVAPAGAGVRATLVPEPREVEIGQPVEWRLDVVHPAGLRVHFPEKSAEDARFVTTSERTVERPIETGDALVHTRARWTTLALEPGDLAPPPLHLDLTGDAAAKIDVDAEPVRVRAALAQGEDAPRPLRGFHDLPAGIDTTRRTGWLALIAVCVASALAAFLLLSRRRRAPAVVVETPLSRLDEIARRFADARDSDSMTTDGEQPGRECVYSLSRLLRDAVDEFLGFERSASTDADWSAEITRDERVPSGVRATSSRLLAGAERIKYARDVPTRFAVDEFLKDARAALEALAAAPRPAATPAGDPRSAGERERAA